MSFFNTEQKLSDGIGRSITRAIYKAIDYKQTETVHKLVDFVREILYKTFKTKIDVYSQFISIPSYYYFKGYTSGNYVNLGVDASQTLTDLVRFACLFSLEKAESLEEVKKVNHIVYLTLTGYSQLFYQIINNRDFKTFENVIDKYRIAYPHDNLNYPKYLQIENTDRLIIEKEFSEDIQEYKKLSDFHRRIKFACLCWLWFLYDKSQIDKDDLFKFTNYISFENLDVNDLIKDLIFYNTYSIEKFDWNRWDYTQRKELQVYSPPQPEDWLTFGFALYSLKEFNSYNFKYENIENTEITKWLPEKLNKCFKKIIDEKEKWLDVNWPEKERQPNQETINANIEKILTPFNNLKRRFEKTVDLTILNQALSKDKVNFFKEGVYKAFYKNSTIREAFKLFKNIELVSNIESHDKETIGINTYFTKAKMMFVKENYQFIYGTGDWGALIAREIDNRFVSKLLPLKTVTNYSDLNKAINESIGRLYQKDFKADLIIISSKLSYTDKGLQSNPDFTPSWQIKGKRESVFDVGYLKEIPIISIFSKGFENKVLICDFKKLVEANEWNRENNYKRILDIEVNTLSNEQALKIFEKNPKEWEENEDGIKLSKEEAIEIIKLNVHLKIYYEILFDILDIEACEICSIEKE